MFCLVYSYEMWNSSFISKTSQNCSLNESQSFFENVRKELILQELTIDDDENEVSDPVVTMIFFE